MPNLYSFQKGIYVEEDHDKFYKASFVKQADSSDFDAVITDDGIEPLFVEQFNENLMTLIQALPII